MQGNNRDQSHKVFCAREPEGPWELGIISWRMDQALCA